MVRYIIRSNSFLALHKYGVYIGYSHETSWSEEVKGGISRIGN